MATKQSGVVNIRGKEYKTIALRVAEFREEHGIDAGWSIVTSVQQCDEEQVLCRAEILNPEGRVVAVGHAQEVWAGQINETSAVENCETSAIGRALAAAGWAGSEYASADELQKALEQQSSGRKNQPRKSAPKKQAPDDETPYGKATSALRESADPKGLANVVTRIEQRHKEEVFSTTQFTTLLQVALDKLAGMEKVFPDEVKELAQILNDKLIPLQEMNERFSGKKEEATA